MSASLPTLPGAPMGRRRLLQWSAAPLLGWWSVPALRAAPASAGGKREWEPLHRFPRMMQEWLVTRVRAAEELGAKRRAALRSREDAQAYIRAVRDQIRACFGPEPERTPLNARVTGVLKREGYHVEKLVFQSRPGYRVTANVYVPEGRGRSMPGVVGSCGHSLNGKAEAAYQSFAQGLARMGYVVVLYDPVGQGERFQFPEEKPGKGIVSRFGGGTGEHIQMGNPQTLIGEFLGAWRAWDGVRALDYLLSRGDVDPAHVGITGNSGGGTLTTWLCGLDSRWTMAAPGCFVTTFRHNAENELPADTEQCPPRVLSFGLDHSDFLAVMAPKPVIILAKERDFFDVRGAEEAFGRLQKLYGLLGRPEAVRLHVGPTEHGYSQENREAMYAFFNGITRASQATTEPALVIEKEEELWCAPGGQVAALGSKTLMAFTAERSKALAGTRPRLAGDALLQAVREVLRLGAPDAPPDYRILRPSGGRGYPAKASGTYAVETEPGIHAIVTRLFEGAHVSRPPGGVQRAVLYVSHRSADAELRGEPLVTQLLQEETGAAFYACDVRGIGESEPNTCGNDQFLRAYGSDYFYAAHGLMLDRPVLGQRTHDVLRVLSWLASVGHSEVHLAGRGWGALPAALAGLLNAGVVRVTLKNALASWSAVAEAPDQKWPLALMPHGVLRRFDLPDVYAALEGRRLRSLDPWNAADGMNA